MTTTPISRIVVGVDGSPGGVAALRWAVDEADMHDARLTAVMAWGFLDQHHSDPEVKFDPHYDEATALFSLRRHLVDVLGEERAAVIEREAPCDIGGRALVESASDADLLVVGARGLGGFKGLLLGSVSQHCLQHSAVPVAVIREADAATTTPRSGIVVGLDESPTAERALTWAVTEARARKAPLLVIHAWQLPAVGHEPAITAAIRDIEAFEAAARRRLDATLRRVDTADVEVTSLTARGNPASAILDAASNAELIVVGTRGR
ncbi:MAG TPA: universal stress protein, partial [Acidimicrobiales bacterium]|nr:universal stress protein [Acidimicrobiales bacterium]